MGRVMHMAVNRDGYMIPLCTGCVELRAANEHPVVIDGLWPSDEATECHDCGVAYLPPVEMAEKLERITTDLAHDAERLVKACKEGDTASREHYLGRLAAAQRELEEMERAL